jgi:hypothetical protein
MSVNDPRVQEAHELFVEQLRLRPYNVILNLNCLLEGTGIELGFVQCPSQDTPHGQSVFDWKIPPGMEEA